MKSRFPLAMRPDALLCRLCRLGHEGDRAALGDRPRHGTRGLWHPSGCHNPRRKQRLSLRPQRVRQAPPVIPHTPRRLQIILAPHPSDMETSSQMPAGIGSKSCARAVPEVGDHCIKFIPIDAERSSGGTSCDKASAGGPDSDPIHFPQSAAVEQRESTEALIVGVVPRLEDLGVVDENGHLPILIPLPNHLVHPPIG
jgi:hypothetical protein